MMDHDRKDMGLADILGGQDARIAALEGQLREWKAGRELIDAQLHDSVTRAGELLTANQQLEARAEYAEAHAAAARAENKRLRAESADAETRGARMLMDWLWNHGHLYGSTDDREEMIRTALADADFEPRAALADADGEVKPSADVAERRNVEADGRGTLGREPLPEGWRRWIAAKGCDVERDPLSRMTVPGKQYVECYYCRARTYAQDLPLGTSIAEPPATCPACGEAGR